MAVWCCPATDERALRWCAAAATKKSRDGSATPTSARSRSRSPSRGRSPGRPKGSTSKKSAKSPGAESRGRSRSNSVARTKKSAATTSSSNNGDESSGEAVTTAPSRRAGRKPKSKETVVTTASETLSSAATSQEVTAGTFVSEKQLPTGSDEDTDVLLRSTITALNAHVAHAVEVEKAEVEKPARKSPRAKATKTETQTLSLAYEEDGRVLKQTVETVETTHKHEHESATTTTTTILTETTTLTSSAMREHEHAEDDSALLLPPPRSTATRRKDGGFIDMATKMTERGWLVSFLSVAVVIGSLLASQLLPRADSEHDLWRAWLPFLTPVVALLLFFHQKDERASGKWVAIALAWRCAAEVLVLVGASPAAFESAAAASAAIANLALVVAVGALVRNKEHESSKATLVALVAASFALFLADRCEAVDRRVVIGCSSFLMCVCVAGGCCVQLGGGDGEPGARVPSDPHVDRSGAFRSQRRATM